MPSPLTLLRAKLHPVRVTSVAANEESLPGSIALCPRLCWAAQLAELEQVEVLSPITGFRFNATVQIGELGEARIPEGNNLGFSVGEPVVLSTVTLRSADAIATHEALVVLVDHRRNAPIEIARRAVRTVARDPSCTPVPALVISREAVTA